jgi:hypothetical protein
MAASDNEPNSFASKKDEAGAFRCVEIFQLVVVALAVYSFLFGGQHVWAEQSSSSMQSKLQTILNWPRMAPRWLQNQYVYDVSFYMQHSCSNPWLDLSQRGLSQAGLRDRWRCNLVI